MEHIQFKKVDLINDIKLCVQFRKDSFLASFGSIQEWVKQSEEDGQKYIDWLMQYAKQNPEGVIHLWKQQKIIGQIEFKIDPSMPDKAYINLFYLVPEVRGTGISQLMHEYVIGQLIRKGCNSARLSVSETNKQALAFYKKHGWTYVKPREDDNTVHLYQLLF